MSYQVLARKWRPKLFEDVIGQDHIIRTLRNAIISQKLAHAYLFTGTRGVGKTSIARLFSKAIRCLSPQANANPCLQCSTCTDIDAGNSLDYLEIDGASNNSVENMRSLIENVHYLPTKGRYKIYVIDEVHMLSHSAFNALLKTLEEPPAHTVFIFATTDPHKLLGTVLSRCQRYDFKNVSTQILKEHLYKVATHEEIIFESDRLAKHLAELGKGSVRDMLSLLDQILALSVDKKITEEIFSYALGLASYPAIKDLLNFLLRGETSTLSHLYQRLLLENVDLKKLTDQLLDLLYHLITSINSSSESEIHRQLAKDFNGLEDVSMAELIWIYETLVKDFGWALSSLSPEKIIEIILQKVSLRRTLLQKDEKVPNDQKSVNVSEKKEKPSPTKLEVNQHAAQVKTKSWEGFLQYLLDFAPATKANLEHGNLLSLWNTEELPILVEVAFPENAHIFKEYLEQKETLSKLKHYLSLYLEVDEKMVQLKLHLLDEEDKKKRSFKTKIEIDEEKKKTDEDKKKEEILNNTFVKEAQKLFNSKVDKIILNKS